MLELRFFVQCYLRVLRQFNLEFFPIKFLMKTKMRIKKLVIIKLIL